MGRARLSLPEVPLRQTRWSSVPLVCLGGLEGRPCLGLRLSLWDLRPQATDGSPTHTHVQSPAACKRIKATTCDNRGLLPAALHAHWTRQGCSIVLEGAKPVVHLRLSMSSAHRNSGRHNTDQNVMHWCAAVWRASKRHCYTLFACLRVVDVYASSCKTTPV